ncbi:U-box domain-containing protein 7 [Magnolia sinica]|uniref:U-box domain-containing protein 7 n=1 Tax=Magnolia sinica TaxID=86752 RepID=UPI002659C323|nr:U-box domain-containing protein 7 [Magnolia sinica]
MSNRLIKRKMGDSSPRFFSFSKNLLFFSRIRRLLRFKTARKSCVVLDRFEKAKPEEEMEERKEEGIDGGIEDGCIVLQRSVKLLHFGDLKDKDAAAREIKRLAKEDLRTRKSLAALGVIPTLVSMLDSEVSEQRRLAVQVLIELANGTYTNKALMVEAGILAKLPQLVSTRDPSSKQELAILLLSLSSLASTQFPFPSLEFLPFLIEVHDSDVNDETRAACLATVYNFSTILDHAGALVSSGAVGTLLRLVSEKESSERALMTLGNLVVTMAGKKAMENDPMVPKVLIETITWEEKPRCQELAAYMLMILSHRSRAQREKMAQLGVVPVLLEVALLGSPLAQKRAVKILQLFKDERQMKVGAHSGPQTGRLMIGSPVNEKDALEGKIAIKKMVKQSLDKNMELIMKRANAPSDCSKLKGLVVSSSSKSLPY